MAHSGGQTQRTLRPTMACIRLHRVNRCGRGRRAQTLGSSTGSGMTLPTSLSSPGMASPQQHFGVRRVGKKKTDMYRETGSALGVISVHLFILQILINTSFQPELSHSLLPRSLQTTFKKPPLCSPAQMPGGGEAGETRREHCTRSPPSWGPSWLCHSFPACDPCKPCALTVSPSLRLLESPPSESVKQPLSGATYHDL